MKDREFFLGDLRVVHSHLGLDFYNRFDGKKHMWLNKLGSEKLARLISMSDNMSDNEWDSYVLRKERKQKLKKLNISKKDDHKI